MKDLNVENTPNSSRRIASAVDGYGYDPGLRPRRKAFAACSAGQGSSVNQQGNATQPAACRRTSASIRRYLTPLRVNANAASAEAQTAPHSLVSLHNRYILLPGRILLWL